MDLFDARSLPAEAKEALRRRAVHAVVEQGRTRVAVAAVLGVTPVAVGRWVKAYRERGEAALAAKPQGRPVGGTKLLPWQAAQVAGLLRDRRPEQLKLPFYLWTRDAVAELVERRFGVRISRWTAGRYLKRWGFTPQKPLRRAREQNPVAVERWLKEEYPRIRHEAKQEGARIFWCDEMGLRSDHTAGRSFSPRGQTPVIPGTGQRFRCNMISAISNQGTLSFMVFRENFTVAVFLRFLRRLIRQQKGKRLYLITDGHPVHRAKLVQAWLEKHEEQIRLVRLPSYSPELNPDEMLNQDVMSNALGRQRPATVDELIQRVRSYLRRRQHQPLIVQRYFLERHVQYAAC